GTVARMEMRSHLAIERARLVTLHLPPARRSSIPTKTVLQEKVPNCLPLLQAKAVVVSRERNGPARLGQVTSEKKNESESPFLMSKRIQRISKPRFVKDCETSSDKACLRAERYPTYK